MLGPQHSGIVTTKKFAIDPRAESEVLDRTIGDVSVDFYGTASELIFDVQRFVIRVVNQLKIVNKQ